MIRRLAAAAALLVCSLPLVHAEPAMSRERLLLRVMAVDPERMLPDLYRLDLDFAGFDSKSKAVDVIGDTATIGFLRNLGFEVEVVRDVSTTSDSFEALSDYLSPAEVAQRIDQYVAAYPALAKKEAYATTVEGRTVWAVKISDNVAVDEDEPAVLVVAQHHAREVMTPEIAMDAVDYLLTRYATDPQVKAWVDATEIWILPNHNPDGTNHVFTADSNWRKNRRNNGGGVFGVDQNRNYPFQWNACGGSSGDASSDTYRGPSPASEPETAQGILELARRERPVMALSYHTYSELVLMPYGCTGSHTPERETFRRIASEVATRLVGDTGTSWYQPGSPWEILYAVDGASDDWFYGELGTYSMTIEANTSTQGFQPDYATWRNGTVERNRPGWQYLLDRIGGSSVRGHVTNACTGAPLSATVALDEVVYSNGETTRTATPQHGRYQFLTTPGTFTLRAALSGYRGQAWPTEVGSKPFDREIRLVPTGSRGLAVRAVRVADAAGDDDAQADPGEATSIGVTLLATGETLTGVTATLSTTDPWVTVTQANAAYGTLAPAAEAEGLFSIQVSPDAPDGHVATLTVTFGANEALCTASETAALRVTRGYPSCPFTVETLDANPGWTIANAGTGGWQFGVPSVVGPTGGRTGNNVYGTNLSGNYGGNGDFRLTTTPFDLRGLRGSELRFWRWLKNEPGYDLATVEASVDGGGTWTEIWKGFHWGEGWQEERVDLSAFADQADDVRFRFKLTSDTGTEQPGFYVDDVGVCGEAVPSAAGKLSYLAHAAAEIGPTGSNGNGTIDGGETAVVSLQIRSNRDVVSTGVEAFLSTNEPGVTIRNGWAGFADVPAGGSGDSLAPHFTVTFDGTTCRKTVPFTLDLRWDGGRSVSTFSIPIGSDRTVVILADDFESDLGWTTGGNATLGYWVREDPNGVTAGGLPVQPEDDTTPSPGVRAWVTGNPRTNGNFNPSSGDVDGGTAWLQSPIFDGAFATRLQLDLKRWFTRKNPGQFDSSTFQLRVSSDGGTTWRDLETLTGDAAAWNPVALDLVNFGAPSDQMRLRVEVTESTIAGDTLLEGLIDDVRVERTRRECDPYTPAAAQAPNGVGDTVLASIDGDHLRLEWQAPPVDGAHSAATGYRVYRSASPSGGFAVAASPTAPVAVLADERITPGSAFYLVAAENNGGVSADAP
ncbi:MAG TPA: M14 family zinc carboxypeptidase [Candidatus Polarisedimenticolaceae bacterium]